MMPVKDQFTGALELIPIRQLAGLEQRKQAQRLHG
jgi:hypothetical protein